MDLPRTPAVESIYQLVLPICFVEQGGIFYFLLASPGGSMPSSLSCVMVNKQHLAIRRKRQYSCQLVHQCSIVPYLYDSLTISLTHLTRFFFRSEHRPGMNSNRNLKSSSPSPKLWSLIPVVI
uniref:Uncharacterized protein n=1 Tax=Picea glauca TaxID=3330 RepID=A0A117NG57_PICGL|nr:hypothetical protein ABT39_MTgene1789 [Picea glauca]